MKLIVSIIKAIVDKNSSFSDINVVMKFYTFSLYPIIGNKLIPDVKEGRCEFANINSRLIISKRSFTHG